jgi:hypothetical protein
MRGKFARWLRSNEPLFWISGKAGSGKSSLMSLIKDDSRTNRALSTWAEGQKVYTASPAYGEPYLTDFDFGTSTSHEHRTLNTTGLWKIRLGLQ